MVVIRGQWLAFLLLLGIQRQRLNIMGQYCILRAGKQMEQKVSNAGLKMASTSVSVSSEIEWRFRSLVASQGLGIEGPRCARHNIRK